MPSPLAIPRVRLRVADLARSVDFYTRLLGFALRDAGTDGPRLATAPGGPDLLHLEAGHGAPRSKPRSAGLFHAALLLPSRAALGGWLRRTAEAGLSFQGFSDHGVSEAVYLADPDGNGLEFYADRDRREWPFEGGRLAMVTEPMDVPGILAAGKPSERPLEGARWGHLHLRVTDLARSVRFYREALGLDVMQDTLSGACFLSRGGYHHHLGLNTWGGPSEPRAEGALGLVDASFAAPDFAAEADLRDPDGIAVARLRGSA